MTCFVPLVSKKTPGSVIKVKEAILGGGSAFFLILPLHERKDFGPPFPTVKKILSPLKKNSTPCSLLKELPPPLDSLKNPGLPFDHLKRF